MTESTIDPTKDGLDHINVYTKGKTELGRALSNFPRSPFQHPLFGAFQSCEGLWYWLGTGCQHNELRELVGYNAKKRGKELERIHNDMFDEHFRLGLISKVFQNPRLFQMLLESDLPFKHYYVYGEPPNCKVVNTKSGDKLCGWLEGIRSFAKGQLLVPEPYTEEKVKEICDWAVKEVLENANRKVAGEVTIRVGGKNYTKDSNGVVTSSDTGTPLPSAEAVERFVAEMAELTYTL